MMWTFPVIYILGILVGLLLTAYHDTHPNTSPAEEWEELGVILSFGWPAALLLLSAIHSWRTLLKAMAKFHKR